MAKSKRSVLITGCSDGGLGAALAEEFHKAGLHVYATARDEKKMAKLSAMGVETLELDVLSESSISACVQKVESLDILVNNAGAQLASPLSDLDITKAKKLFDLNVWAMIQVTQAFLPLILKSDSPVIAFHSSSASVLSVPMQSTYNASKAAMAMFADTFRLEMEPFGVKVVDLRTGLIKSNLIANHAENEQPKLPEGSIYSPAKEKIEKILSAEPFVGQGMEASKWAKAVVSDLLKKNPPPQIWRGDTSWLAWLIPKLPFGIFNGMLKKAIGFDKAEPLLRR